MSLRAIIIEDEENGLLNLQAKLQRFCPAVEIAGTALTAEAGLKLIHSQKPDLVFLDIHLGPVNGFDLLTELTHIDFHLIITTDHPQYGIEAVRANAVDYLLKPIDSDELIAAVDKALERQRAQPETRPHRMAIPVSDGYRLVSLNAVLYIQGNNQRTLFHLSNGKTIDSPRLLKQVAAKLQELGFARIHKSFVVNLEHVEYISRTDGGYVKMSDGKLLRVSQDFYDDGTVNL